MKKYLFLSGFILFATISFGQNGVGFNLGFATSKTPFGSLMYFLDKNAFSIGVSFELNNALGKKEPNQNSGFGIGDGHFFLIGDIGYTRMVSDKFSLEGELSFGKRKYYQNFSDNSFSEGGYHKIYKEKSIQGIGAFVIYDVNDIFGIFAGYNTIRQASIGLRIKFVKQTD
ncbi:MAG TPA: hypothetical protein VGI82_03070 [Chitinophagaceae bacterium]|jgi:hypothetical protein